MNARFVFPYLFSPGLLAIFVPLVFSACGRSRATNYRATPDHNSLLADVKGIDPQDKKLAGIKYVLICDGVADTEGLLVDDNATSSMIKFTNAELKDGTSCALEVRANPQEKISWLSVPKTEGLYYASNKEPIAGHKLSLKLFKVYAKADEEVSPLAVETEDGGVCSSYDIATRTCLDSTPITPPAGPDSAFNALGIKMEKVTAANEFKVTEVQANGVGASAALEVGDVILLLNGESFTSIETFNARLDTEIAAGAVAELWLNVVNNGQNRIVYPFEGVP